MLKLNLQYFGHLMRRVDSLEKTLMVGGLFVAPNSSKDILLTRKRVYCSRKKKAFSVLYQKEQRFGAVYCGF